MNSSDEESFGCEPEPVKRDIRKKSVETQPVSSSDSSDVEDKDLEDSDDSSVVSEMTMESFVTAHSGTRKDDTKIPATIRRGRKKPDRTKSMPLPGKSSLDLRANEEAIRQMNENSQRMQRTLDESRHSIVSTESMMDDLARNLDDELSRLQDELSVAESMVTAREQEYISQTRNAKERLQNRALDEKRRKREERLERAKERIENAERRKEDDGFNARQNKLLQEMKNQEIDMSEKARLERVYNWYTRAGMPHKTDFIERVEMLPRSAGVSVADVELLPWDKRGKWVNVAKISSQLFRR